MRFRVAGVLLAGLLACPVSALAVSHVRLVYVRGAGAEHCPDEMELRMAVAYRLGYDPFTPSAGRVMLTMVERSGGELVGRAELVDAAGFSSGKREVTAPPERCDDLLRALALSVSLALDPEPEEPESEPQPAPAAARPAASVALSPPAPSTRKPSIAPFLGMGAHAAVGAAPALAGGARFWGGARWASASVELGARFDAPASESLERGEISSSLAGGELAVCARPAPFLACAAGVLASLRAESSGVSAPDSQRGVFAAAGTRLGAEFPLGDRFSLRLTLDVLGTLTPVSVELGGRPEWEAPPVSGTLAAGLVAGL